MERLERQSRIQSSPRFRSRSSPRLVTVLPPKRVLKEITTLLLRVGPKSHTALQRLLPSSQSLQKLLTFGTSLHLPIPSLSSCPPLHIARGGYTGEDGFEISVPAEFAADFAGMLLEQEEVKLAGLAARDSLRLEAGLCLYGNDLDESVGVGEAALNWVVGEFSTKHSDSNLPLLHL